MHNFLPGNVRLRRQQQAFAVSQDGELLVSAGLHLPVLLVYSLVRKGLSLGQVSCAAVVVDHNSLINQKGVQLLLMCCMQNNLCTTYTGNEEAEHILTSDVCESLMS